ncbi:hypothetical protein [Propionibacterium australiense]|uniref:Uncharacterized protein n=1 Tax=Propionibacterium australiense TaxID=119981 RepID=A0A383SB43_9ACTN|nr:hypothetical protein [Propionibacterium australiense]RLP08945.1 hypothetical protein D9T14_07435 [Propionibacterium australiense]RLP09122.1 hypothetical protein D7U36_08310 [Propionibacterium australiense]SYZ34644.1 Hypothetical protein PROPAUS_2683 [Propionibacterium australiense]VEH91741.1 Uncharacterised protein [Propionibacterium australiense]
MTWNNPTPAGNATLAKGAAIAALVCHGLGLALFALFASALSSLLLSVASLPTYPEGYTSAGLPSDVSAALTVMLVLFLIVLAAPVALAIWMLVAAHRGRSGQVLAALILYSTPFVLLLLAGMVVAVTNDQVNALPSLYSGGLPDAIIIVIGWVGWWQMTHPPAVPAAGQSLYQVPQPGPYAPPVQQYPPTSYPGSAPTPPWQGPYPYDQGQGSPWQGQNPPWQGQGRMG